MNRVCARTPLTVCVCVCVSCRDHSASAASLISQHHGTCLNSKRGLERTSWPPGESLRLPSAHSGHSSYHTLFNFTMSNPPVGLKKTKQTQNRCCWSAQNARDVRICVCLLCVRPCMKSNRRWEGRIRYWDFFSSMWVILNALHDFLK